MHLNYHRTVDLRDPCPTGSVHLWAGVSRQLAELHERVTNEVARRSGLTAAAFAALHHLAHAESASLGLSELAGAVAYSSGGVTKLADRLVAEGLVERVASPSDRRVVRAVLTEAGAARLRHGLAVYAEVVEREIVARLGGDGLARLAADLGVGDRSDRPLGALDGATLADSPPDQAPPE